MNNLYHRSVGTLLALLVLCCFTTERAEASHFRYGEIRCEPTGNAGGLEYQCFAKESWRLGTAGLSTTVGGTSTTRTYNFTGPATLNAFTQLTTTVSNATGNYAVAEGTFIVTFPQAGTYTINMVSGCCRIGGLGNAGISFNVDGLIEVGNNAMPRSSIPPIVGFNQSATSGNPALQQLPVFDPDGDDVQCRLAPAGVAGGGAQPSGFSVSSSCQMSWDNATLTPGLFWTQIYVDQLDAQGNIVQTTPYDFLLELGGSANTPPTCDIDGVQPFPFHNGQSINVHVGDNLEFDIIAEDADGDNVETSVTSALGIGETYMSGGSVVTPPFGVQPQPFTVTVQDIPLTAADIGTHQLTASVSDAAGGTSQPCQLTVNVTQRPCTAAIIQNEVVQGNQGVATVFSPDGISKLRMHGLDNLTVASVAGTGGETFSETSAGSDIYELDGGQTPPARVEVAFDQVDPNDPNGTYNIEASSVCPAEQDGLLEANLDPPMAFEQITPEAFKLEAAYPNPFQQETTIRFGLADAAHVKLAVYDVLGREVAVLTNGSFEAGSQSLTWNGRDQNGHAVATGTYLYRLQVRSASGQHHVETRRLVLVN